MSENEIDPVVATVYIAVNEDGDYTANDDEDSATESLNENYGGAQRRVIEMEVDITAAVPKNVKVSATLPEREDGSYSLKIAQS